ncbi:peptide chain release factor 1 [Geobacter sulfurreducens]|jgi:peptide chain release factor 1|uniref:Peptide chain release factor 1 n=1 Tax=Geobacter sulfurreducens (strain ATCC 51573 / DSM 12127 / PCA) TaxID=243231 RepID=RF1_GEOSL|nr:peptide chain release factor 1 [Geobacter sulfurreducens]Q748B1.1 RecName: Full=Peptide chain release factor 1; Short=RF-1 [Geobacter sulfurreducens PCA]AAR36495.1 peptide chain release factor 1 [Geobacter sulfurreducens PCA]ADI85855.1 peptide chain release factor 1 [Geobacter sulfurreducens KN400]QVW34898.1 peptide chain release factor 1 [Geobacter sulfurreducens]UAC03769.1 peptide chain release factor 1 [Geobacter sulfurreducens]UTG92417.1 peptide chain release factor 1 [Geobacter sulfur
MFEKIEELEVRYHELESLLADPAVLGNQPEFRRLSREHNDLTPLIESYRTYKKVLEEMEGNRELLADPEMKEMAQAELEELEQRQEELEGEIKLLLLPRDPNDDRNVILEIRAGTGGDESALFAGDLFRMYSRFAERNRWKVEVMSASESERGGFKEIVALIEGQGVFAKLKYESGTHRVQRVPETEAQGRIHTSACTVAVLPEAEDIEVDINPADLKIDVYRASGAGGQHVNKTESAVRITHIPTGIVVECQDERSQIKNRAKAMKVLKTKILDGLHQEQNARIAADRKQQVGSGDRSERIRTYNFPQGRMTDHRIGLTLYRLDSLMEGDIAEVVDALRTHYQMEALKAQAEAA